MRWIRRIVLGLTVLAVLIGVGGTFLLRSDWLGQWVLAQAGAQVGLDIQAESFSVDWGGDAALGRVTVQAPLTGEIVFRADRVEFGLGPVPWLVLSRSLRVHAVELDHPTVFLRRSENGRWNAQDIWARVQARIGRTRTRGQAVPLPQVVVREAEVQIAAAGGATQTVGPVGFHGRPEGPILWKFDLRASSLGHVEGQIVEGADWAHEIRFDVNDVGPLIQSLSQPDLTPLRAAGRWKGSFTQGTLRGGLQLDKCRVAHLALHGGARVEATAQRVTIHPQNLIVSEPGFRGEAIHLNEGRAVISRKQIALESLAAQAGDLGGRIDGRWELEARRGECSGSWTADGAKATTPSCGTYQLSVKSPQEGPKEAQANITVQAWTPLGSVQTVADIQGGGAEWQKSQWQIKAPTFSWSHGVHQVDLAQTAARIDLHWPEIRLTDLSVPGAQRVNADAHFDVQTRRWSATLGLEQWRTPALKAKDLDLRLTAEGDDQAAHVSEFRMAADDCVVTAQGGFSIAGRQVQNVKVFAEWPARLWGPASATAGPSAGRWQLEAAIAGQFLPIALDAQATLTGRNITLGRQQVSQIQIPAHARVDATQVEATTQPFDLLGGKWQLLGQYDFSRQATGVRVMATDLSLAAIAGTAGLPVTSTGQAQGEIRLQMPGWDLQKAVAMGSWSAQDVNIPPLTAQRAQGVLRIANGSVRLAHIQLEQDAGLARGRVQFQLDEPQVLSVEFDAQGWPVPLVAIASSPAAKRHAARLVMDGQVKLRTNIVKKTADGDARLTGKIVWEDKDMAEVRLSTRVREQTLDIQELHAQALGGSVEGTATIPLNRWSASIAQLRWQGIEPKQVEAWLPAFGQAQGTIFGSLVVEQTGKEEAGKGSGGIRPTPEATAHPLGPMRFVLDANTVNGRFGSAEIGPCRITGYLDPTRLLIENADLSVLGGRLDARARLSRHTGKYYGSVVADFNDLSLDQLVHAVAPNAGACVGRLAGSVTVLPAFDRRITLAGEGRVNLTQSDLVNSSVVRTLYDTLSLRFGAQEPTGTGEIRLALEGPAVALSSIQYFNRGVEVRGSAMIKNVNLGADSPIEGYAVASTHVLKGIRLPGLGDLDRLLNFVQTDAASVKINGAMNNVQVKAVPLPEVLGPFRRLLWAQLRE